MANLNTISTTIKQFSWLIVVLILVIVFIFLIVIRFFFAKPQTQKLPPINTMQIESLPASNSNVTFRTTNLNTPSNTPQSLPIYTISTEKNFLQNADIIAQKLNFTNSPQELNDINLKNGLAFSKEDGILTIYASKLGYQKVSKLKQPSSLDPEILLPKAVAFASNLGLGIDTSQPQITYSKFIGDSNYQTENIQEAQQIHFTFTYSKNNIKIMGDTYGVRITLDSSGEITTVTANALDFVPQQTNYPVIEFAQALKILQSNQGKLIKIKGEREDIQTSKNLSAIDLENSYIAYYLPSISPQDLQPVWVFEGTAIVDQLPAEATYVVPAIKNF